MDLMRKKPATNGAHEQRGEARGAAFSAVPTADIKCASRWNTSAFGEQPSSPHHLALMSSFIVGFAACLLFSNCH